MANNELVKGARLNEDATCPVCYRDYSFHKECEGADYLPYCTSEDCPSHPDYDPKREY